MVQEELIRVVNLKEYPRFWQRLMVVASGHKPRAETAEQLIDKHFNMKVTVRGSDKTGIVVMKDSDFSWFVMQWS